MSWKSQGYLRAEPGKYDISSGRHITRGCHHGHTDKSKALPIGKQVHVLHTLPAWLLQAFEEDWKVCDKRHAIPSARLGWLYTTVMSIVDIMLERTYKGGRFASWHKVLVGIWNLLHRLLCILYCISRPVPHILHVVCLDDADSNTED